MLLLQLSILLLSVAIPILNCKPSFRPGWYEWTFFLNILLGTNNVPVKKKHQSLWRKHFGFFFQFDQPQSQTFGFGYLFRQAIIRLPLLSTIPKKNKKFPVSCNPCMCWQDHDMRFYSSLCLMTIRGELFSPIMLVFLYNNLQTYTITFTFRISLLFWICAQ